MFREIWGRVEAHQGEVFKTTSGLEFTYLVEGSVVRISRTNRLVNLTNFRKVYELWPVSGPGALNQVVQGSSYIWAIMNDVRIKA